MKVNMISEIFIVPVVLLLVMSVKTQSANVPYYHASGNGIYFYCYNYTSIPKKLENPTQVRVFSMESAKLQILKNGVLLAANLINLESLYLRQNAIKTIELGAFRGANKIKYLDLCKNLIEEIDLNVFKDLPNLQTLRLYGNQLKGFLNEAQFPKLNLTYLDLGNCRITSIPINLFRNLERLERLSLQNNQLQVLDWTVFLPLKSLKQVAIERNPFHCDCQVKILLDFLDRLNISWGVNYYLYPSCQSSSTSLIKNLIGVEWDKIDRELLVCPQQISPITLKLIIALLTVVVVLLLGVIITSAIYISVRYSKTKRNELPTNIYANLPRGSKPSTASPQAVRILEDLPHPPLFDGLENVYEICGYDDDHIYEVPVIPPMKLHQ